MILVSIVAMLMSSTVQAHSESLLPPCRSSPNCISSKATDRHRIEPLAIRGNPGACFDRLRSVLGNRKDTTIIAADDSHIRVEFRTFLGFVYDGLFILDVPNGQIQVRSAARLGNWDTGENRRRMEEIRGDYSR
jgi:uncharacterized protein (DUF1499 family)